MRLLVKSDSVCQPVVFHSTINAISVAGTTFFENRNALSVWFVLRAIVVNGRYQTTSRVQGFV